MVADGSGNDAAVGRAPWVFISYAHEPRSLAPAMVTNNPRVHLFLAGPLGLALLLGHRWNRERPTVVYEDVQNELTYEAAFTLDA